MDPEAGLGMNTYVAVHKYSVVITADMKAYDSGHTQWAKTIVDCVNTYGSTEILRLLTRANKIVDCMQIRAISLLITAERFGNNDRGDNIWNKDQGFSRKH
ncbi:hypothetical protein ACROYT_G041440 [Oculina patagonica]